MTSTTAKIIADSVHPRVPSARITTFETYAPRYLLAEINTHRVLARSAASSRAIPISKRIEMAETDPYVPLAFGKNQPGMVSSEDLNTRDNEAADTIWRMAVGYAVGCAEALNKLNNHKQQANRLLEPFVYVHGVITATEWVNFWHLRLASNADPAFVELATKMKEAYDASTPVARHNHLPYTDDLKSDAFSLDQLRQVSASRCARISYTYHDGKPFDLYRDIARCDQLIHDKHMSPFDHVASIDTVTQRKTSGHTEGTWDNPEDHRQYWGWIPYRVEIERRTGYVGRRSSFKSFTL